MWHSFEVRTNDKVQVVDITERVADACRTAGHPDGLVVVFCPHTTAGMCVNEGEPGLHRDIIAWLERTAPTDGRYAHNVIDDNADAHLRSILLGHTVCVPLVEGKLALGQWQRILLVECDGPRTRTLRSGVLSISGKEP